VLWYASISKALLFVSETVTADTFVRPGSEVVEAALKLAREYHVWTNQPQRVNFISRDESYHGTTIGSLSLSGHVARRAPFEPLLLGQRHSISSCNLYRQKQPGETDAAFLARKVDELERKFHELGPDTVAAVIMEPVVGAALGCMPAVPGYLSAVRQVCNRHGALLILDEVMCGTGRTGTLHAWEQEDVVPDLQTLGKGLGGGYQPASALLVGRKISDLMSSGDKTFTHGHTYQNHPVVSAAALKVQQIIHGENLLANVRTQGAYMEKLLRRRLGDHPNVGDIRGRGLFWGVEFVRDRGSKEPFGPEMQVAAQVQKRAQLGRKGVLVYHGQGCAGAGRGDHVMLMPAYDAPARVIECIVEGVALAVEEVFAELGQ
jgi:adenosylmethionine-8-amino-7-oxononanoate aminotransferase